MDIDITRFVMESEPFNFSASIAEMGQDAGRITWNNAKESAKDSPLLESAEQLQALRDHMRGFGAWDEDEIAGWDADECNAIFIQLISGDMRESGMDGVPMDEFDWNQYEIDIQAGQIAGRIGLWDDGRIGYYLGD